MGPFLRTLSVLAIGLVLTPAVFANGYPLLLQHQEFLYRNKLMPEIARPQKFTTKISQDVALVSTLKGLSDELIFPDTKNKARRNLEPWLIPYVTTAEFQGLLKKFRAKKSISRKNGLHLIMKTLANEEIYRKEYGTLKAPYKDIRGDIFLKAAYAQNIFRPEGKRFKPRKALEQHEFFEALYRALVQKQKIRPSLAPLAIHSVLVAQNEDGMTEKPPPNEQFLPPPYEEVEMAKPLISSDPAALPDLIIESVERFADEISIGSVIKVTVRNIGDREATGNFGVYDRPDWYDYKPGWNSSIHMAAFISGDSPDRYVLFPGRTFTFLLYGRCEGNLEKKTQSLLIAVDPNFLPAPELASGEVSSPPNDIVESNEENNTFTMSC